MGHAYSNLGIWFTHHYHHTYLGSTDPRNPWIQRLWFLVWGIHLRHLLAMRNASNRYFGHQIQCFVYERTPCIYRSEIKMMAGQTPRTEYRRLSQSKYLHLLNLERYHVPSHKNLPNAGSQLRIKALKSLMKNLLGHSISICRSIPKPE